MKTDYLLTTEGGDFITTEGGDRIIAYTLYDAQEFGLGIDWNRDGDYDMFQEADRLLRWKLERGREKIYNPSGNGFSPYDVGQLVLTLDNNDGRYDPWNTSKPLYNKVKPGCNVQFVVKTYEAPDVRNTYLLFTGTLVDIRVNGYRKTVDLIVEDGWRFLADWQFFRFAFTTSGWEVPGELELILDSGMIFNQSTMTYDRIWPYKYPWGTLLERIAGITQLPRHWWWDGTAKGAIEMIVFASLGRAWIRTDGKFDFATLQETADAPVATLDESKLLKDIYLPNPWENLRSEVVLKGSKNNWTGNKTITTLRGDPILVQAGKTVEFSLPYTYEGIQSPICTRVNGLTWRANANAAGSGADLTPYVNVAMQPEITTISVTAKNNGAQDAYVVQFDVQGEVLEVLEHQWKFGREDPYREASFTLENMWLTETVINDAGYIKETETTINDRNRINLVGNSLKEHLSTVKPYPVVQMRGRFNEQFKLELEDKVTLNIPTLGINGNFRISKIAHQTMDSPQDVLTTLWLYPPIEPAS